MKLFGISAKARVGKDRFFSESAEFLQTLGFSCRRLSFADCLKNELFDFCISNYSINPFTENNDEKSVIRDILIAHGMIKRRLTKGQYWINYLRDLFPSVRRADFVFVTDVRFKEYDFDEIDFIKQEGGKIIYLENENLDFCGPEKENLPKIKKISDFDINWPRMSETEIKGRIQEFWKQYI